MTNLDFSKLDGLIPAVIQDHKSGRILMLGFMNEEAFQKTVETGNVTFYSRSRNKLWMKGESSGHLSQGERYRYRLRCRFSPDKGRFAWAGRLSQRL